MSRNQSQISEPKRTEEYQGSLEEPEIRHRENVMVLDISNVNSADLSNLKLAHNGHVEASLTCSVNS
jgi:hypothetical protein